MTEIYGPGAPLPPIPDDLTVVQFMLDSHHVARPVVQPPNAWLIEDSTGRKVGLPKVSTAFTTVHSGAKSLTFV